MATVFLKPGPVVEGDKSRKLPVIPDRWNAIRKLENHIVAAPDDSVKPSIVYCRYGDWDARPRDRPINHLEVYDAETQLYWCLELIRKDNLSHAEEYVGISKAHKGKLAICKIFTVYWQGGTTHEYFGFIGNNRPLFDYLHLDPWRQEAELSPWKAQWKSQFKEWQSQIDKIAEIMDEETLCGEFDPDQLRILEYEGKLVLEFEPHGRKLAKAIPRKRGRKSRTYRDQLKGSVDDFVMAWEELQDEWSDRVS